MNKVLHERRCLSMHGCIIGEIIRRLLLVLPKILLMVSICRKTAEPIELEFFTNLFCKSNTMECEGGLYLVYY